MTTCIHEILCTIVFSYLNFHDKHTLQKINRRTKMIHINDLLTIDKKYLRRLAMPAR